MTSWMLFTIVSRTRSLNSVDKMSVGSLCLVNDVRASEYFLLDFSCEIVLSDLSEN